MDSHLSYTTVTFCLFKHESFFLFVCFGVVGLELPPLVFLKLHLYCAAVLTMLRLMFYWPRLLIYSSVRLPFIFYFYADVASGRKRTFTSSRQMAFTLIYSARPFPPHLQSPKDLRFTRQRLPSSSVRDRTRRLFLSRCLFCPFGWCVNVFTQFRKSAVCLREG